MSGQPGSPGAQVGTGFAAVADWWLAMVRVEAEDTETAATPVKKSERARMRIPSFIVGNSLVMNLCGNQPPNMSKSYAVSLSKYTFFIYIAHK
jgi:hypothetical protein